MNGFLADDVVVIQHQEQRFMLAGGYLVREQGQNGLQSRWLMRAQGWQGGATDLRVELLQSGDDIAQEARWLIVLWFQGKPGYRLGSSAEPLSKQSRFAKADRR